MKNTTLIEDIHKAIPSFKRAYNNLKKKDYVMVDNKKIKFRKDNYDLAVKYIEHRQDYLVNAYGRTKQAEIKYCKTLNKEISYIKNVLYWFNKWNLNELNEIQLKEIYNGLDTGKIKSITNRPLSESSKKDYFSKVMRNGFFKFFGKDELAKKVILRKFYETSDVRFFDFDDFLKIVKKARYDDHKLLMWLLFDTGVEVQAVLQLRKLDFTLEKDEQTGNYYIVHIRKEISKKQRQVRDLFIYHKETNDLLKSMLEGLKYEDKLFNYGYRNVVKFISEITKELDIRVKPNNDKVKVKDFRSSCATHFLKVGWTSDEVKARLGHKASSTVIDRYVSYLGLNQSKQRKEGIELDMKNYKKEYDKLSTAYNKQKEDIKELQQSIRLIKEFLTSDPKLKENISQKLGF